jgi:RNA polymerase sigma factor (TIGR02999 family)
MKVMAPPRGDAITLLLQQMRGGDEDARSRLIALVYPQLRRIAAHCMRAERRDHTLQPTALVHEAFVRLASGAGVDWRDRAHFFALSAELMRRILVDAARRRRSLKRGANVEAVELDEAHGWVIERPDVILGVDRLLERLAALDARQARIVEMRYFAGLTEPEIAEILDVSERTVKRDWSMARAWMRQQLTTS